jgi:hypothetical protein
VNAFHPAFLSASQSPPSSSVAAQIIMAALAVSPASVCCALLTIALSVSIVILGSALRLKLRIAKGLASVPGPQGTFLLGMLPTALKHKSRIHDFVVCSSSFDVIVKHVQI